MKKIKFNVKGATWDSVFLAFAKILTLMFGILSAKILSSGLSLKEYGTYSQANLVTTVGTSLILMGLPDALNFFYNKKSDNNKKDKQYFINTIFFIEIFLGIIFAGIVLLGQTYIVKYFGNELLRKLLIILALIPVMTNLLYFYQVLYVSVGKAKLMSLYNIVMMFVRIISIYFAVYILKNLIWIYIVLLLLDIIQIVIYAKTLWKNGICIRPYRFSVKHIKCIMEYALPMGIYAITNAFTRDIDKLIVGRLSGTENLAIYTNCSKVLPLDFLVSSFAVVLIPYIVKNITEGKTNKSVELFSAYLKIGYYSVWILGTMVLIQPETMIKFLYSSEYVAGKHIFIIYIFDSMLRFASMHLILTAANKAKNVMIYSAISLGLNFILNILFYHIFGLVGPAIATLVVAALYTFLILNKTITILNTKWLDIFKIKELLGFILSLMISLIIVRFFCNVLIKVGLNMYISMIVCMLILGCVEFIINYKKIILALKEINALKL